MQWYAFHKEPPGGVDGPNGKKERLLKLFGGWCENVIDLLVATDEDAILCSKFAALKDFPFLDSYQLALELDKAWRQSLQSGSPIDVVSSLRRDLSNNVGLRGSLPPSIGNLQNLTILVLVGCSFSGPIPDSIGSLPNLIFLSLNSNGFSGPIPPSIGNLSKLSWLDLSENQLNGTIPISSGTTPGLDMLLNARHFHLSKNQISGSIPLQLFSPNMNLIHVILDNNQLTGNIPVSLGSVKTLEVIRLDWNSLNGSVPSRICHY